MAKHLRELGIDCTLGAEADATDISSRQLGLAAGSGGYARLSRMTSKNIAMYDALITCKATKRQRSLLENASYRESRNRPCFVAFQPGLEFRPERGFSNRHLFDALFMNNVEHAALYNSVYRNKKVSMCRGDIRMLLHLVYLGIPKRERSFSLLKRFRQ